MVRGKAKAEKELKALLCKIGYRAPGGYKVVMRKTRRGCSTKRKPKK